MQGESSVDRGVKSRWRTVTLLMLVAACGLAVRRHVYRVQAARYEKPLPFTQESAVQFYLVRRTMENGLPALDRNIGYPEGVNVRETFSIGAEYLYSLLSRLLPEGMDLHEKLRWIETVWFCSGIVVVGLITLALIGRNLMGVAVASTFYAVCPAAVVRSSGIELSRENIAFPLIALHLLVVVLLCAGKSGAKRTWIGSAAAAGIAGSALVLWDMTQFYLTVLALWWVLRLLAGGSPERKLAVLLTTHWAVIGSVCLANRYLAAHGVISSPAMLILAGGVAYAWLPRAESQRFAKISRIVGALVLVLAVWSLWGAKYAASYGHFAELLVAKMRFLNSKPADPAVLTFNQRIMWTPALNSATWALTFRLFPGMLLVTLAAALILPRTQAQKIPWLFFYSISLAAYCLFVRFHAYVAIFGSVLAGLLWRSAASRAKWIRRGLYGLVLAGVVADGYQSIARADLWGRPGIRYPEMASLCGWLREHGRHQPVAANFGISGAILTYAECPIVLYPKFESPAIRRRVREYAEAFFRGDEEDARRFADRYGVGWVVWSRGEFSPVHPEWQMRYMADALVPAEDAAARVFEFSDKGTRYFPLVWENRKYRVFRAIGFRAERRAEHLAERAVALVQEGRLEAAERAAWEALSWDMNCHRAMEVVAHCASLRDQGFSYTPDTGR